MFFTRKRAVIAVVIVALVAAAAIGFNATQAKKEEKKAAAVVMEFAPADIARVEKREIMRSIAFSGSLAPVVQTTVKSRVAGELSKVFVKEGDSVAAGQVIAQVETADVQARLDAQVAALEEAKARFEIADKNRINNEALLRQKFISQNAFDTTLSVHDAAAATVRSAEAQLRIAQKAMSDATIRAPFAAIVSRKIANAGEKVGVDSPLFALVDLGVMEIEAPAPASEIPSIKVGQPVRFGVDGFGNRQFQGRVERINPQAEQNSRAITIYISVPNRDGSLKGGMFAKGDVQVDRTAPSTVIPANAVRDEAGQTFVYTIEDGKIARRPVKVGISEPQLGMIEVVQGLDEGLTVVSVRATGLKVGAPAAIKTKEAGPANTEAKKG
ncbi:MAG: efflux RND transporter periplasmic adaptor subunit [Usitatibacter sp.]